MFNLFKAPSGGDADEEFMPWSDDYEIGIASVDEDHRGLFIAANNLHRAIKRREGKKAVADTFDMLTRYVHEHFAREEQMMQEAGYRGLAEHKRLHANFVQAFFSTKQSYIVAPKMFDFDGFLGFLKNWLVHHVLEEDPKYAPEVRKYTDNA